jgi:ADP-heptose:LPS heptosyltransferase
MVKYLEVYKLLDRSLSLLLKLLPKRRIEPGTAPRKILVIKLSAMGDCLCLFPTLRMIADSLPGAQIDWLTSHRSNPALFAAVKFIHHTYVLPRSLGATFPYLVRMLLGSHRYDLVIDFDQYYRVSELISAFAKATAGFRTGLKGSTFAVSVDYAPNLNEKLMFAQLATAVLGAYGVKTVEVSFRLGELLDGYTPTGFARSIAAQIGARRKPAVAVYPGSSLNASFRRWAPERYLNVVESLKREYTILIMGGVDEHTLLQVFKPEESVYVLIEQLTLRDVTWLIREHVTCLVGNDGGLLHIAESQGVPIVGIFGPALSEKWGSINPDSIAIEHNLECRPCLRNYQGIVPSACRYGTVECLRRVQPDEVVAQTRRLVSRVG